MKQLFSLLLVAVALAACSSPSLPTAQVVDTPPQAPAVEPTMAQPGEPALPTESFSSDQLGLCFSYPQGYQQLPYGETIEIAAFDQPGADARMLFWLEMGEAYGRSAETIADEELNLAGFTGIGRSTITLGGEPAVVLDGMPGQDLQRRVYVVRQPKLYVLVFMPTRSENQAASQQLETLYTTVTSSWAWSPCPAR